MKAIIVIDLQGFKKMADDLSFRMDHIGINSERIRAVTTEIVEQIIKETNTFIAPQRNEYIGGDSWAIVLHNPEDGIKYGCLLLRRFASAVSNQGLFHLKPSIAINIGNPVFKDGKFIDNASVEAYQLADKGYPFTFYIAPSAQDHISQLENVPINPPTDIADNKKVLKTYSIDWQNFRIDGIVLNDSHFEIPCLLLDSDTYYAATDRDAISLLLRYQNSSRETIHIFGGPVPTSTAFYEDYLRQTVQTIFQRHDLHWTIMSYISVDDPLMSYIWLELLRSIKSKIPHRLSFSAFTITKQQLRPFSFFVFDKSIVHVGLRQYSSRSGTPVMSSSIMLNNKVIAERFYTEFMENWRIIGELDDKGFDKVLSSLKGVTEEIKNIAHKKVNEFLAIT